MTTTLSLVPSAHLTEIERNLPMFGKIEFKSTEARTEAIEIYYPFVRRLSDEDLVSELKYWRAQAGKKGFSYKEDSPQAKFCHSLKSAKSLSHKEWANCVTACIALRSKVVPHHPYRDSDSSGSPAGLKQHRLGQLVLRSDWSIVQSLASIVGSRAFDEHCYGELSFIGRLWKRAWKLGPERFVLDSIDRNRAHKLVVDSMDSDRTNLLPDQISLFKSLVGRFSVPLGESEPAQLDLLTSDISSSDSYIPVSQDEQVSTNIVAPEGQLDLLSPEVLHVSRFAQSFLYVKQ